jgi:uncharacterized protein (TIGR02270 family)
MTTLEHRILWDVIEEHLAEGAFRLERCELAHRSPIYSLDEVADGPELLLSTHLAALALTGPAGQRRVLEPILLEPDAFDFEERAVAVLWALSSDRHERLLPLLHEGSEGTFQALSRAVELHPDIITDRWVQSLLSDISACPAVTRARVWALAAQRPALEVAGLTALSAALRSDDVAEVEAAAVLLRSAPQEQHARLATELARSGPDGARFSAALALLQWREADAFEHCGALAQSSQAMRAGALELLAVGGGPREHALVLEALGDPALRDVALRAIGFSGNAAAVDRLLPWIDAADQRQSRLAAEAFSLITGFDLFDESHQRAASTDDADNDADEIDSDELPSFDPVDALPLTDASAAQRFWDGRRSAMSTDRRHLQGDPDVKAALVRVLRSGPMRARHALDLGLRLRSRGRCSVNTGAFARMQRQQAIFTEGLPPEAWSALVFNW